MLKPREVRQMIAELNRDNLYNWTREGLIPGVKQTSGGFIYREEDIPRIKRVVELVRSGYLPSSASLRAAEEFDGPKTVEKTRLLVIGYGLPRDFGQMGYELSSFLRMPDVDVAVVDAKAPHLYQDAPEEADRRVLGLLSWAVLGESALPEEENPYRTQKRGCDLYVGIETKPELMQDKQTLSFGLKSFHPNDVGTIGFEMAKERELPAILLDATNMDAAYTAIYNFVKG